MSDKTLISVDQRDCSGYGILDFKDGQGEFHTYDIDSTPQTPSTLKIKILFIAL